MLTDAASDVAVVMATYNGARYIAEQLDSIAAQTIRPAEVLIYDDGSSASELVKLRTILAGFCGARLIPGANVGISANFDRAIRAARHPYLAFADQDDVWAVNHIAALRQGIGDTDLVYGDMGFMDATGRISAEKFSDRFRTIGIDSDDPKMFEALLHNSIVWGAAAMVRREMAIAIPMPETPRHHDWWLSVMAVLGKGVRYVDEVVTYHRLHDANASSHHEGAPKPGAWPWSGARHRRQLRAARSLIALRALQSGNIPMDDRRRYQLARAISYAESLISDDDRLRRAVYALRHRRYMTSDASASRQFLIALAKLL